MGGPSSANGWPEMTNIVLSWKISNHGDIEFEHLECQRAQQDDSAEEVCAEAVYLTQHVTANVVDRNNGRIVATASTVEHSIKNLLECGRSYNAKAATIVGEVLAMRLKVEGLEQGQGRGVHVDVNKEVDKKGFRNRSKVSAVVDDNEDNPS
ncbi:UDP-glucose:glycoprotein glucosyltransferase-like [Hibiscus syriacus]|uniref:UDP-glucose:glycoprotein glucosyltransferase-like n=1 Tax=Hibiscus syriacus TaxID=106335 RepID=A0A6A3BAK3_HIBSY|nr:UDP-glucose:glycoprotein glucosyltransferase-like [Hibiscus syriacus]